MPRSLARVLLRQDLRRIRSAPAPRCAAPPAARSRRRSRRCRFPMPAALPADRNPYADPAAPYKVDRVQASGKFPEPMLNTPKTITVLSKEVLADKNVDHAQEIGALDRRRDARDRARAATPSATASSSAASMPATTSSSTASAIPASASARISSPSRSRSCAVRPRPLPAAAPPAARSTSSPSRRRPSKASTTWTRTFGTDHTKRVMLDVNQVISPTLRDSRRRPVPGRQRRRPQLRHRRSLAAASSRRSGRRPTTSSSRRTTSTPICTACRISACRTTGQAGAIDRGGPYRFRHSTARISTASSIATSRPRGRTSARSPAKYKVTARHHADQQDPARAFAAGLYRHAARTPGAATNPNPLNGRSAPIRRAANQ